MPKCTQCNALLPEKTLDCPYCGCHNDMDLNRVSDFTIESDSKKRFCPFCEIPMPPMNLGEFEDHSAFIIEQCTKCQSVFMDHGELNFLIQHPQRLKNIPLKYPLKKIESESFYLKCPKCQKEMNKKSISSVHGEVIVEECGQHGIFFSNKQLFQFKKLLDSPTNENSIDKQQDQSRALRSRELFLAKDEKVSKAAFQSKPSYEQTWWYRFFNKIFSIFH